MGEQSLCIYVYFYTIINNNDAQHLPPRAVTHTRHACHHVVVVVAEKVKPALIRGMRERKRVIFI